jgi:hypothetical protein
VGKNRPAKIGSQPQLSYDNALANCLLKSRICRAVGRQQQMPEFANLIRPMPHIFEKSTGAECGKKEI